MENPGRVQDLSGETDQIVPVSYGDTEESISFGGYGRFGNVIAEYPAKECVLLFGQVSLFF